MAAAWLERSIDDDYDADADLNHDGKIDNADVDIMAANWLAGTNSEPKHYYYHYDGLGSIIAVSNDEGKRVETYKYDSFGSFKIYNKFNSVPQWNLHQKNELV